MNVSKPALYVLFLLPGVLLILAPLIDLPYGFYTFLRIIILLTSAYILSIHFFLKIVNLKVIIFIIILVLYNPIIPIHFSKEIWMPINFITAGIFFWTFNEIRKNMKK